MKTIQDILADVVTVNGLSEAALTRTRARNVKKDKPQHDVLAWRGVRQVEKYFSFLYVKSIIYW